MIDRIRLKILPSLPNIENYISTGDVALDLYVSGKYFTHKTYTITTSDSNSTTMWLDCDFRDHNTDNDTIIFTCWERDNFYGILTHVFVYLPSSYTVAHTD